MIVDSHAYCFEAADSLHGYSSVAEHLRWIRWGQAKHYQPAIRLRDRASGSLQAPAPEGPRDSSSLPDVNFRVDHESGRVLWTVDGEDYTKYYYPPNLRSCAFSPESLISEMDYAGIDVVLLHTHPTLGRDPAYQAEAVRKFPQRLRSMAMVDEWRIRDDVDTVIRELTEAITRHELHAVKFNWFGYMTSPDPWDDGFYRPFWEVATALKVPIFFTLGMGPRPKTWGPSTEIKKGYLNELRVLMRWMERYPDNVCSITHGFPYRTFLNGDRIELPREVWEPFQNRNLSMEVSFPVRIGDIFDFPYREVWPTIETIVEHIGADRLLWGTDMPFQNRHCTYQQSRDYIEKYCDFLGQEQLDMIMGGTAARILGLNQ